MPLFKKRKNQSARVVICDDQGEVRAMFKRILEKDGRFELVGEATNGKEAVDLVAAEKPDALLLDFAMPEMTGVEALRSLRDRSPDTKVVVVTSFFGMGEEAIGMGADAFVSKSAPPKEVVAALDHVLWGDPVL